jgi:anti-sigma factor ChrR (cupin superfamily)
MSSRSQFPIQLNADRTRPVLMRAADAVWLSSPQPGVERRMLEREGGEVARATSIVRYAPGSHFPAHRHAGGEEFLVLDGVFSDAAGDYGPGCYVRNPPGSDHAPHSLAGCTLFVKLRQMRPAQSRHLCVDSRSAGWTDLPGGASQCLLYSDAWEEVALIRLEQDASCTLHGRHGLELLFLDGECGDDAGRTLSTQDWLRLPGDTHSTLSARTPTLLYCKSATAPLA